MNLKEKYQNLIEYIKKLDRVAVAFSSGVDSTFLLYAARQALGDDAIAITAISDLIPKREQDEASQFCNERGIKQIVYKANPFEEDGFSGNPSNRCYICKKYLYSHMKALALGYDIQHVLEGSNLDDEGDYRPGMQAIAELGILSPLRVIGFTKQEIRDLSAQFGLPTANKPSFACLASRIPYEETITENKLFMVEKAEELLFNEGFKQFRVRIHGDDLARIEVLPEDYNRFMDEEFRIRIYDILKVYGFNYVSLDLKGYRTGSMNEVLK
ncbi:conserved hypothetical protein TIGR00268 [Butyrivibrio fibrisolvens 16/4]|nr:conserved hypothetical protein TIGR00268 [Butyrivibrio fibrisolvens 16/4]